MHSVINGKIVQLFTSLFVSDNNVNNQLDDNEAAHEQPPAYEHPPDYEEASSIKIDMNSRRSSRQMSSKRARSRSRYAYENIEK